MRFRISLAVAILVASCAAPAPGPAARQPKNELGGRVSEMPNRCVLIRSDEALRVSNTNRHLLIYNDGATIWTNDLGQCTLNPDDILVTEAIGSSYCRGDLIRSIDRVSRTPSSACVLGDFVPHER